MTAHMSKIGMHAILPSVARSYPFPDRSFPIAIRQKVPPTLLNVPLANAAQIVHLRTGVVQVQTASGTNIQSAPAIVCIAAGTNVMVSAVKSALLGRILVGEELMDQVSATLFGERILGPLGFHGGVSAAECIPVSDEDSFVAGIFGDIARELELRGQHYENMVRSSLCRLIVTIDRNRPTTEPAADQQQRSDHHGKLDPNEIVTTIAENYAENHTLQGLATQFGVNPSYLSRMFREHTGTPLFEYINRIRIQKACLLLKRGDMSILDIALSVGYNNVSFFNRYFRRIMNMAPGDYRKLAKG